MKSLGPAPGRADLNLRWALLLAAAFVLVVSGSALAEVNYLPPPEVETKFDADFPPKQLSRSKQTPLSPWVSMSIKTSDGSYPPDLKGFEVEEDRHLRLNSKGVPVCPPGNVDEPQMKQRCKKALIGRGKMDVDIHFPESVPILARSEVTLYNAGLRGGVRTLFLDAFLTIPTPADIVTTVRVEDSAQGRYGLKLVGSIPKIAGGSGSITRLAFRFHKGIFSATCPADRRLDTHFKATFVEGNFSGGEVARNCTPSP